MDRLLPVTSRAGSYKWPQNVKYSLLALAKGPRATQVESGEALYDCIRDMRRENGFVGHIHHRMARDTADGISLFFDDLLSRADSRKFFRQVLPGIASLALSLPLLLESQSHDLAKLFAFYGGMPSHTEREGTQLRSDMGLKLLCKQQQGIVVMSQRLVASLLACSFLCLYPSNERRRENLPYMNLDRMFAGIYDRGESIEHKLLCLLHYFERVLQDMPDGVVSFERKAITAQNLRDSNARWSGSGAPLCPLTVVADGNIEDLGQDCLQVDFANRMLGGGALGDGCVQEEIRFMINPELAAGMVFLPAMSANESIEIVGAERYSAYTGYASTFRFTGDFLDSRPRDAWGRRQTHIIAIDALSQPGDDQFRLTYIMRELNKAYCGFLDAGTSSTRSPEALTSLKDRVMKVNNDLQNIDSQNNDSQNNDSQTSACSMELESPQVLVDTNEWHEMMLDEPPTASTSATAQGRHDADLFKGGLGIATGNWGCGVFGGNLPLKCMLQWLAASQAGRPFLLYFSFQNPDASRLQEVADWILQERWLVGELWNLVSEYALGKHFDVDLFDWILPLPGTNLDYQQQPRHVNRDQLPTESRYFNGASSSNSVQHGN